MNDEKENKRDTEMNIGVKVWSTCDNSGFF